MTANKRMDLSIGRWDYRSRLSPHQPPVRRSCANRYADARVLTVAQFLRA